MLLQLLQQQELQFVTMALVEDQYLANRCFLYSSR